ncbi:anti-sigma factor [Paractinoplanes toevensis]|uniref:anti-sigma factor n=1 Tax=Paractinoplanes toevensis TaxID=571911 RepID=UPI001FE49B2D|nr:anti-sigma factor [Actinoplanes toevensis]
MLLALSEPQDPAEADHLAECPACRQDLDALRHVAELGAEGQDLGRLPAPPERVWLGIEAHLAAAESPAPVRPIRSGRTRPRWLTPVLAAAAAAVLAVAGTVVADRIGQRAPAETVTARATLRPLATVPADANGTVRVLSDGLMRVDVRNLPLTTGFHEVWLIDPDHPTRMIAIGNLADVPDATLPVPPGVDMNRYRLVDISDEPHDGDATHSGRSLLRGTLTS